LKPSSRESATIEPSTKWKTGYSIPWSRPDIGPAEIDAVSKVTRSGWVTQGHVTSRFENLLAKYCGVRHAIVVNNGSSALLCAFMAHGANPHDRVLIPDFTHIASANAPKLLGCKVSMIDVDPDTFLIDPIELEYSVRRIRPKFVVVVDVAGLPNDMHQLSTLARRHEFTLIVDAAEAIGAQCNHRLVGTYGQTSILSFHAAKQLTTIEGGAILTDSAQIANRCRMIRSYGENRVKYVSERLGMNFRNTDVQSAIGIVQLKKLEKSLSRRDQLVHIYKEKLSEVLTFQEIPPYATRHTNMLFLAKAPSRRLRDRIHHHLQRRGIDARTSWPPIHRQVEFLTTDADSPHSISLYEKTISLPLYNTMKDSEAERVVAEILELGSK
jgi:perosamine synthetase